MTPKQSQLIFRWAVLVGSIIALAYTLPQKPWQGLLAQVDLLAAHWSTLILVVCLSPVNWALEALKWKTLARNYQQLSFGQAFIGVLTGLGIGALVPQWMGDFMGRTWHQEHTSRREQLKAVPAIWLGNFAAFQVTHFMGLAGLAYLVWQWGVQVQRPELFLASTAALLVLTLAIYFRVAWFAQPLLRLPFLGKWKADLQKSLQFSDTIRAQALMLAAIRYMVFFGQWWLLLRLANPATDMALAAAIALIFSLKSSVPTLNLLGDLGVREYAAVVVLKWLGWDSTTVIPLTLCIWIVNLLLPTLVGFVFMLPLLRWSRNRQAAKLAMASKEA